MEEEKEFDNKKASSETIAIHSEKVTATLLLSLLNPIILTLSSGPSAFSRLTPMPRCAGWASRKFTCSNAWPKAG